MTDDADIEEVRRQLKAGELKMSVRELEPLLQRAAEMAVQMYAASLGTLRQRLDDIEKRLRALEQAQD